MVSSPTRPTGQQRLYVREVEVVRMSEVYRAPMSSRRSDVVEGAAVERALTLGLCGLGGSVLDPAPETVAEAVRRISGAGDDRLAARIRRFADAADGSFVWTRDGDGLAWLGRLEGGWFYDASAAATRVDLTNVRPCHWLAAPIADHRLAPGVRLTFARGGKNWQRIRAAGEFEASLRLWGDGLAMVEASRKPDGPGSLSGSA
jgi:hypothetical protein